jgi:hypothetical protein
MRGSAWPDYASLVEYQSTPAPEAGSSLLITHVAVAPSRSSIPFRPSINLCQP